MKTVLVISDEPSIRDLVKSLLARAEYGVTAVDSGFAAHDLAHTHDGNWNLLIVDHSPRNRSILDSAREIFAGGCSQHILLLSGFPESQVLPYPGIPPRSIAYLRKPFTADALLSVVGNLMNGPGRSERGH